jgi:hypothetical protein
MSQVLTEVNLNRIVPSVFATSKADKMSDRYGFIPTIDVVRGLEKSGFMPVMAKQSNTRIEGKKNFTKHMMRFRHVDAKNLDGHFPEIVLVNSHDGSSSYQIRAGIYRLVCSNGLIVGDDICCHKIRHSGDAVQKVVQSANEIIDVVPEIINKSADWKGIELKYDQKKVFAEVAATLKWDEDEIKIPPTNLLIPKRMADTKNDLWTTFNVIQENLIKGKVKYRTETGRNSTRAVNSVTENVRLNTALWSLTEKMAELAK